ncbi:phosphate acyltransferase PlsX [Rubinisphaera italica]|uniref:Phosphate acyltransferase n=1 Tax=Rubinisphaera italica TaxID=2527969 RepID=A0A5C5XFU2_9PLAN|nr:phosphate acyltransferase PlsX [Rubinisphaera italica]TWT61996.1 Phosphate acyltransferase [Rubinisphaera italica]
MRIALDAMGGDDAPGINIDGALKALAKWDHLVVDLVGPADQLNELLAQHDNVSDRLNVLHASEFVGMDEKPTEALRKKPNASITVCWKLMAEKKVQAVVSAGNTGAVVAAGLRTRLFLKQVKRPGIAVVLPTLKGQCVLMDVGANPAARADHLYQYGVMGSVYASEMLGIERPRIGLLNIGSEDGKGTDLVREAHAMLSNSYLKDQYIGNVEGRGIYQGEADVVICEGFVGNVVLKVSEGMADMMFRVLSREIVGALDTERDKAGQAFKAAAARYEYREFGGAPLLGVDGLCMISHGSSDAHAMSNALGTCIKMRERQINQMVVDNLAGSPTPTA